MGDPGVAEQGRLASRPGRGAHVILVGLPGAGKTTVGAMLAEHLARPFVDLDTEIVRHDGREIARIFAESGEAYFRSIEWLLTSELREKSNLVVAPGGGWATKKETVALLRPPGRIIHLDVSPETALARLGVGIVSRPLLRTPDPLATLRDLRDQRVAAYAAADASVNTETLSIQAVVAQLAALATAWDVGVG